MDGQKYIGIYLSRDTATVVCLGLQGRDRSVLGCFSVSVEETEGPDAYSGESGLAALIARGCAERIPMYRDCEVAVALDCAMFMQHNLHSEFDDPKRIAATIRFDTEEALATDITDLAIAFQITSGDQAGSELAVFTAQRKLLSDILGSLQSNNIDPVTIEPDVSCLSRFIRRNVSLPGDSHPLFCILSQRSGYLITFAESRKAPTMRTFLLGPTQTRGELLAREVPVTAALVKTDEPINCLKVFDSADSVNYQQLSEKLGIEAGGIDLAASAAAGPEVLVDCANPADFAIACGAALAHLEKAQSINFRNDFSPFQGKKLRLQRTAKFASYSVTVLVLAVGLYLHTQLLQENKYRNRLRDKIGKQYSAVMFNKLLPGKSSPLRKLEGELRRIENVKKGLLSITGEKSVSAKLTLVLEAFNKCAEQTDLNIDSISITGKSISIAGDTSSRRNTLKLRKAIEAGKLGSLQERLEAKGSRDSFHITIVPKK